ncbi:MAG: hypothetical protein QHJ82_05145, partial [Verrucomicrobiota bacterium]|nr:hypothetical protein [Verrucomicrobiota bacterium]
TQQVPGSFTFDATMLVQPGSTRLPPHSSPPIARPTEPATTQSEKNPPSPIAFTRPSAYPDSDF